MNLNIKKDNLKKICMENDYGFGGLIYKLINDNSLDNTIKYLDDKTVPRVRLDDLTGEEQFIEILENFISYFIKEFSILGNHLPLCLNNCVDEKKIKFLLSKKYWGNNENGDYYIYEIKKLIIENFYQKVKLLYNDSELKKFFNKSGINDKMSLNNKNHVEKIYIFLKDLVWSSHGSYHCIYLFMDCKLRMKYISKPKGITLNKIKEIVFKECISQFDSIIYDFEKNNKSFHKYMDTKIKD